ncbi:MAG: transposase [Bacteroidales bacterium]
MEDCFEVGETTFIKEMAQRLIKQLEQEVALLEEEIDRIFASMGSWQMNYQLIQTIKGIGPVLAKYLMIYTENFTRFSCAKKFACYAGIAPFEYSSGSSVKGRTRVHRMANKHLKSLLNMSALSVIRIRGEYKQYYERRTEEGKNKMSTLNIIRNKLVLRVFAVVKRQTPYVDLAVFA